MATTNSVQEDEPRSTALERQVQSLPRPWNASPSKTRFWKNNYAERQDTVFRKKTKKVPVPSDETERDRRLVTPQADRSDKM